MEAETTRTDTRSSRLGEQRHLVSAVELAFRAGRLCEECKVEAEGDAGAGKGTHSPVSHTATVPKPFQTASVTRRGPLRGPLSFVDMACFLVLR